MTQNDVLVRNVCRDARGSCEFSTAARTVAQRARPARTTNDATEYKLTFALSHGSAAWHRAMIGRELKVPPYRCAGARALVKAQCCARTMLDCLSRGRPVPRRVEIYTLANEVTNGQRADLTEKSKVAFCRSFTARAMLHGHAARATQSIQRARAGHEGRSA